MNTGLRMSDVKPGDKLIADDGFTCLARGQEVTVMREVTNRMFVLCAEGRHYLDGPSHHRVVGFARAQ